MKFKILILVLISVILVGCDDESYDQLVIDDLQIEMAKEFDVPISNVKITVVEKDQWRFTVNKFLVNIEGDSTTYLYIGTDFDGYDLLIYESEE